MTIVTSIPPGYILRQGSSLDRALLVKFMQRTYQELYPSQPVAHLAATVDQYFSSETPLWWVVAQSADAQAQLLPNNRVIACLWLGNAIDQIQGDRHAHIFLLYVAQNHRRRGIGAALVRHAEAWAAARGDRQIGLQVFQTNQPALSLYSHLGYHPQSLWMVKSLQ
jgi:ribosomal protein S18 acetylase RimI-like enzyme